MVIVPITSNIAAIRATAERRIVDAFRLAGATAPERARALTELGLVSEHRHVASLVEAGIVHTARRETLWLDEAALIARRDHAPRAVLLVISVSLLLLVAVLLGVVRSTRP